MKIFEKEGKNKKSMVWLLFTIIFCFLLSACDSGQTVNRKEPVSTDLSVVQIEGVEIGVSIDTIDLEKYTPLPADTFTEEPNVYRFEEMQFETDGNKQIQKITISNNFENKTALFSIKGENENLTIQKVVELLGKNYNDYWYDREQKIKAYTYHDEAKEMYATFTFNTDYKDLIWVILSR
ncbi:hypothetical protein [Scatolibacter rhodanostii]|uniref:hypothetical protein n=1 Tax=Scatolibacter rhodanostii TaxID=2014781 RepID=UPI000C06D34B|nr:hypothetical protein [Scatolibacter rhodanostii]